MYSLGIASRWGEISTNIYTGMRPTLPPIPLVLCLSHRYSGQSVVLTTHPHQAPKLNREESCTYIYCASGPLWPVYGEFYLYLNPLVPELQAQWELQTTGI